MGDRRRAEGRHLLDAAEARRTTHLTEDELSTARILTRPTTSRIVRQLYIADRPIGFGELRDALHTDGFEVVPTPTLTNQLRLLEQLGMVRVLTNKPLGQRRGVAVLYALHRPTVDDLMDRFFAWTRNQ